MSTSSSPKPPIAARVVHSIVAALEQGVKPWVRPWRTMPGSGASDLPLRANGQPYRGINTLVLWAAAIQHGFSSNVWLTYKQAIAAGGRVRKGEHGFLVVFYKPAPEPKDTSEAEPRQHTILRGYTVFNRDQIDGLEPEAHSAATLDLSDDAFAARFARVPAVIRYGGSRAYYDGAADRVQLPPKPAFADHTLFYATLAHELGHWTRHPSRLDRDFGQKRFGDAGYALEELVAELCSAFVGAVVGLPAEHLEDHASYMADWLVVLKDNPSAFLTAAGKAQAAADYLLHYMGEGSVGVSTDD